MTAFSIREDLQDRPLAQQAEILWISGPHAFDAEWGADRLGVTVEEFHALVRESEEARR